MEKTIRLKRELAYTGMILKIYRDTVVANGIEEVYDYIHHDGASTGTPWTALLLKSRRESWMRRMSRRSSVQRENLRRRRDSAVKIWNS